MSKRPDPDQLRCHLAHELHYLAAGAVRFRDLDDSTYVLESVFVHARNLLAFTDVTDKQSGWHIWEFGGAKPAKEETRSVFRRWVQLINDNLAHLGNGRTNKPDWPVPYDRNRLVELAQFCISRLRVSLERADQSASLVFEMHRVVELAWAYLESPSPAALKPLADLVPCPE